MSQNVYPVQRENKIVVHGAWCVDELGSIRANTHLKVNKTIRMV
jgi:hypothetical protein